MIVAENISLGLGCSTHNRFFDRVERRAGVWKILKRQSLYDMGSFAFPVGLAALEPELIQRHPREYAALAYLLEKSGFPVNKRFATKGSPMEQELKAAGRAWLLG